MRFKDFFLQNEIFNQPLPIIWKTIGKNLVGKFTVNDKDYLISMIYDNEMPWEIKFEYIDPITKKKRRDITGTGDAFAVFSTVLSGIQYFIDKKNPSAFILSVEGEQPSRLSLYRRLLDQMLPKNEWDVQDLGSTFYVEKKGSESEYQGYSDKDFEDYFVR